MIEQRSSVERFLDEPSAANRNAIVVDHMYLCRRAARKFSRASVEWADLCQVAAIGLIKAANNYRAEHNTPFDAYAWVKIVGELMHYVRDFERVVRLPRSLRALDLAYSPAWEQLAALRGCEPTTADIALAMGVSCSEIGNVLSFRRGNRSLDNEPGESGSALRLDRLRAPDPDISVEDRLTVVFAVASLAARERYVVLAIFAGGMSQQELADTLGLSQSQISKLLKRTLEKLLRKVA